MARLQIATPFEYFSLHDSDILFVLAEGNYCRFMLSWGKEYLIRGNLRFVEESINQQFPSEVATQFVRLGRSIIVRLDAILYFNVSKGELLLRTGSFTPPYLMKGVSGRSLKILKQLLEL